MKEIKGLTEQIYFYKGVYFDYDKELILKVKSKIKELKKRLNLSENTEINFGSRDAIVGEKKCKRYKAGLLKDF